ncbi:MAG: hypothetical protein ACKVJN_15860, partial [Woeseiales bacterium]
FLIHFEVSLDDEFVSRVYKLDDNFAFIQDSDEFAICSMRGVTEPPHTMKGFRGNIRRSVLWAEEFTGSILRHFIKIPFYWHYRDIQDKSWADQEFRAEEFFDSVSYRLRVPDTTLQIEDREVYEARRRRKLHFSHLNQP